MALDLAKTHYTELRQWDVQVGEEISEEGLLLMLSTTQDRAVLPTAGAGTDRFVGVAYTDNIHVLTNTKVVEAVVANGAVQLPKTNLVPGQISVYDVTAAGAVTEGDAANATEFSVTDLTGLMAFNAGKNGNTVKVYFRYTMTTMEAKQIFFESMASQTATPDFSTVMLMQGENLEVYTTVFDAGAGVYAPGDLLYTGANGLLTKDNTSTVVVGRVISAPNGANPQASYLGALLSTGS